MLEKVSKAFKQMATSGLELATPRFLDTWTSDHCQLAQKLYNYIAFAWALAKKLAFLQFSA